MRSKIKIPTGTYIPAGIFILIGRYASIRSRRRYTRARSSTLRVQHVFVMLYLLIEALERRVELVALTDEPCALLF